MLNLDSQQLEAVESQQPVTVVVAGPGSGKTRVLVARIHHLINHDGANPADIAVMTFTNAGANELRERLGGIRLGYLGTLHGWCFRLLQRHGAAVGYREGGINLLSAEMSEELLQEAAKRLHWKGSQKALAAGGMPLARLIHQEHRHTMKRNNLVDYDGVLVDALALLEKRAAPPAFFIDPSKAVPGNGGILEVKHGFDAKNPPVFRLDLNKPGIPKHLLVDESQDNAEVDWDIYKAIGAESAFFVGDTDQGVFSFRGASPRAFTRFANLHEKLFLEWNYRSGTDICEAANLLIACNANRIPKSTIPATPRECFMTVASYDNCLRERCGVAAAIATRLGEGGVSLSDIAVLCRTNDIATKFRDNLAATGIQVRRPKQMQLPLDWGHALNVLNLWNDPRNDIVCERVLNEAMRCSDGGRETVSILKKRALASGRWLCTEAMEIGALPKQCLKDMDFIVAALAFWKIGKESLDLIKGRIGKLPQSNPTLPDLLHDLYQSDRWEEQEEPFGVHVGTVHGAKGREWDIVFLPAWEEGVFPQSKKDTDLEEERRLAFVAITRARNEVYISYAAERIGQWETTHPQPSRFIAEAGLK